MPTVIFELPGGVLRSVEVDRGVSVLEAARLGDIAIEGTCGGSMACATCHVFVDEAFLAATGEKSDSEEAMLEGAASDVRPNSRLSCQIRLSDALDGLVVQVAEEQM